MNPLLIFGVVAVGLIAAYFLFFRSIKAPDQTGRPDRLERPELTGTSQYENRKKDTPKNI